MLILIASLVPIFRINCLYWLTVTVIFRSYFSYLGWPFILHIGLKTFFAFIGWPFLIFRSLWTVWRCWFLCKSYARVDSKLSLRSRLPLRWFFQVILDFLHYYFISVLHTFSSFSSLPTLAHRKARRKRTLKFPIMRCRMSRSWILRLWTVLRSCV